MKKAIFVLFTLLLVTASCSKDNTDEPQGPMGDMISPKLTAYVDIPQEPRSPMTGILEVYPCNSGSSIYFGNYIDNKLTVFNGFYPIEDGEVFDQYNRKLLLPKKSYNMVYWGTPVYEDPIYSSPAIVNAGIRIGADLSTLYLALRKNAGEDTYSPVYDLVHAVEETNIANEDLSASLKRVVAGLKVIVTMKGQTTFDPDITNIEVRISNIAEKLNFYTGEPKNMTKTVKFNLVRSADNSQMTNATVMLFPSDNNPKLELRITLKDGSIHTVSKSIDTTLSADVRLTLNIVIGDILIGEEEGNFTIENWVEASETIEFPIVY